MENNINSVQIPQPPKRPHLRYLLLVLGGLMVLGGAILLGIYWFNRTQLVNEVSDDLKKASAAMAGTLVNGAGYPNRLPASISATKDVKLDGAGSFDGTSYCIVGMSLKDTSVVYHIDSTAKTVMEGDCGSSSGLPKPTTTGPLSVMFASNDRISFSWYAVPYVSDYTLQCATDDSFSAGLVTKQVTVPSGTCDGLKEGTIYYSRVRANNKSGSSDWSPIVTNITAQLPHNK